MTSRGQGESLPCIVVEFEIHRPGPKIENLVGDCLGSLKIAGLKEDNEKTLGISANKQVWIYNGKILENDKSLNSYWDLTDESVKTIVVKSL